MHYRLLFAFTVVFALAAAGCQSTPEEAPKGGMVEAPGKAPEEMVPKGIDQGEKKEEKSDEKAPTAALAKCDGCGMEVPKAELASHDGMMLCKQCMASHKH